MPWVRIDEHALNHIKLLALSDGAFRLWVEGLAYCQRHLTDGAISHAALKTFRYSRPGRVVELTAGANNSSPLWVPGDSGFSVHDYLQWNDSKEAVLSSRQFAKVRMALVRDPQLRRAIQARDGSRCRYCGHEVNWMDRKGSRGATYDHVVPGGGDDLSNLVVACRGCNSKKGQRTPDQAGMFLIPTRSDLDRLAKDSSTHTTTTTTDVPKELERHQPARDALEGFAEFWAAYPKKKAKPDAEKAWRKLAPDAALVQRIMRAVAAQSRSPQWEKDGGQFVPYPASWLRGQRWEDELDTPFKAKPKVAEQFHGSGDDWWEECKAVHDGKCTSRYPHMVRRRGELAEAGAA